MYNDTMVIHILKTFHESPSFGHLVLDEEEKIIEIQAIKGQ